MKPLGDKSHLVTLFTAWMGSESRQERERFAQQIKERGVIVQRVTDPRLVTAETHGPCKVFDANGLEWRHLRWVHLDTGEAEQYALDGDGKKHLNAAMSAFVTQLVNIPRPILIMPIERKDGA